MQEMKNVIKYAVCDFEVIRDGRRVKSEDIFWEQGTLEEVKNKVEKSRGKIAALFFPADVLGLGYPLDSEVTRERFENEPERFGVCYYLAWCGYRFE